MKPDAWDSVDGLMQDFAALEKHLVSSPLWKLCNLEGDEGLSENLGLSITPDDIKAALGKFRAIASSRALPLDLKAEYDK